MQKAKTSGVISAAWNKSGNLYTYLASRNDASFNYATMNVKRMIQEGLIPMSWEQFCKNFEQGDVFLLQLNGQVNVMAKINRANKTTMAFHCPRTIQMPIWNIDSSDVVEQPAVMLGYTGIRLAKDKPANDSRPTTAHTAPVIPLAALLDTPSARVQAIWVSEIKSIKTDGRNIQIEYIK